MFAALRLAEAVRMLSGAPEVSLTAVSIASRLKRSYAAVASTETTVRCASACVRACKVCTKALAPARDDRAYWCGLHAAWKCDANGWARARATRQRKKSSTTQPRVRNQATN